MAEKCIQIPGEEGFQGAIASARDVLLSGGVVAYPTESFYGLAVDAAREEAVRRLFMLKGRNTHDPILLLVCDRPMAEGLAAEIGPTASRLMDTFWPGPLTLIFRAAKGVSPLLTGGSGKIGVRYSRHQVPSALACAIGRPITGTSANLSGQAPSRTADEVVRVLGGGVDLVLDGGTTEGKAASTVLDVTVDPPQILRQGLVPKEDIDRALGH